MIGVMELITDANKPRFKMADLFCGAGGMTQGAIDSGYVEPVLAINHWRVACLSHENNHPDVKHICARIEDMDLRSEKNLPKFNLLAAGIECTHHSNARGGRPINDQRRTSAWRVLDWIELFQPKWCVFENVSEFLKWGPIDSRGRKIKGQAGTVFNAWVEAIRAHGYYVEWTILNAADYGAATSRKRLFIIARRGKSTKPVIWPRPTHDGKWRTAREIIDWSLPCPSIFTRKKSLADKTLRRIEAGLKRFVEPFVVDIHNGSASHASKAKSVDLPLTTIVTKNGHAVAMPFLSAYHNGNDGENRNHSVDEPLPTQDTSNRFGVAQPFLVPNFGERDGQEPRTHDVDKPLPTVTGHGAGGLTVPYMLDVNHGGYDHRTHTVDKPIGTITTKRGKALSIPFLTKFYGTGGAKSVDEPLDSVTTRDRFGLAMASLLETMRELHVVDIGFRMLNDEELARATGFPEHYDLHGNKGDRVRQIGNAVCPPVMAAICRALAEDN